MNLYLAAYAPDAHGVPYAGVIVRRAAEADLPACGMLAAQREGGDPRVWTQRLALALGPRHALFVAVAADRILGYGRVAWLTPTDAGGRNAPDGWYLSGVVVDSAVRRRGVGRALTHARCTWVWAQQRTIYYVVAAGNKASVDLHRELGFFEVTRDFEMPGVTFGADDGVLFACTASSKREQVVQLGVRSAG